MAHSNLHYAGSDLHESDEDDVGTNHSKYPWWKRPALSLFWRTFVLLAFLLSAGIYAWMITFRALEFEPRTLQAAQQVATLVNLSRSVLQQSSAEKRQQLIQQLNEQESIKVITRSPTDLVEPYEVDFFSHAISAQLHSRLGEHTFLGRTVNEIPGLWVAFDVGNENYWLRADSQHIQPVGGMIYFTWISIALLATLAASAVITGLINRPLQRLSFAASRIREGEFEHARLDESMSTREIRELNKGFNRMALELARLEKDRTVMLAGISHDLRTPLARLRLEVEMSVANEEARRLMVDDINHLDLIINKFMDYARPTRLQLVAHDVGEIIEREAMIFQDPQKIQISLKIRHGTMALTDKVELGRVFANLFENARRYGNTPGKKFTQVVVSTWTTKHRVIISVRDFGPGMPGAKLAQMTAPFFRGDDARTHASGAGLGLSIVEKNVQRMGGSLEISNAPEGGLVVYVKLRRAETDKGLSAFPV